MGKDTAGRRCLKNQRKPGRKEMISPSMAGAEGSALEWRQTGAHVSSDMLAAGKGRRADGAWERVAGLVCWVHGSGLG